VDEKTLKSIQILALNAVENPTYEDQFRFICRWFSKTYSIPLNQVDQYSEEEILQIWFEDKLRDLLEDGGDEQRKAYEDARQNILYEEELQQAEDEDEEWVKEMKQQVELDNQKNQVSQEPTDELNLLEIPEQGDLSDLSFNDDIDG
jgi:hypothetical protein